MDARDATTAISAEMEDLVRSCTGDPDLIRQAQACARSFTLMNPVEEGIELDISEPDIHRVAVLELRARANLIFQSLPNKHHTGPTERFKALVDRLDVRAPDSAC